VVCSRYVNSALGTVGLLYTNDIGWTRRCS
jgi:hypothetical protein